MRHKAILRVLKRRKSSKPDQSFPTSDAMLINSMPTPEADQIAKLEQQLAVLQSKLDDESLLRVLAEDEARCAVTACDAYQTLLSSQEARSTVATSQYQRAISIQRMVLIELVAWCARARPHLDAHGVLDEVDRGEDGIARFAGEEGDADSTVESAMQVDADDYYSSG